MKSNEITDKSLLFSIILGLIFVNLIAYLQLLDIRFAGADGITLITTARLENTGDITRIFSEPMMAGTSFDGLFYRPLATLVYGIGYSLWGFELSAFTLLNLALHIVSAVLVLFTAWYLFDDLIIAVFSALIFSLHPVAYNNLVEPAGLQDILPVVFVLGAVLTYLASTHHTYWRLLRTLSVVIFAVGLFSKEIAAIALPVIMMYAAMFHERVDPSVAASQSQMTTRRRRIFYALKTGVPYIIVFIGYFAIRTQVLGGLGGYGHELSLLARAQLDVRILTQYVVSLFIPGTIIEALFPIQPTNLHKFLSVIIISMVMVAFSLNIYRVKRLIRVSNYMSERVIRLWLVGMFCVFVLLMLAYPIYGGFVNRMFVSIIEGNQTLASSNISDANTLYLLQRARNTVASLLVFCVLVSGGVLFLVRERDIILNGRRLHMRKLPPAAKGIAILIAWLIMPLVLYLLLALLAPRTWYIASVAASIIIATGAGILIRRLIGTISLPSHWWTAAATAAACAAVLMIPSTLFRDYSLWRVSGEVAFEFLHELEQVSSSLTADSILIIYETPSDEVIRSLSTYGIESWLEMKNDGQLISVEIATYALHIECVTDLELNVSTDEAMRYIVTVANRYTRGCA